MLTRSPSGSQRRHSPAVASTCRWPTPLRPCTAPMVRPSTKADMLAQWESVSTRRRKQVADHLRPLASNTSVCAGATSAVPTATRCPETGPQEVNALRTPSGSFSTGPTIFQETDWLARRESAATSDDAAITAAALTCRWSTMARPCTAPTFRLKMVTRAGLLAITTESATTSRPRSCVDSQRRRRGHAAASTVGGRHQPDAARHLRCFREGHEERRDVERGPR